MPRGFIKGLATETGGKTSHVGIFAAALGIPAVTGVKELTSQINSGENIIIDGIDGEVICRPTEENTQYYLKKQENYRRYEERLLANIHQSAETLDGYQIHLLANIESNQEVRSLHKFGAEGVGLYRTEFLYMSTNNLRGIGVLITDHNVRETLSITDRAYIINEGEIISSGSPHQIVQDEKVKQIYLGDQFSF